MFSGYALKYVHVFIQHTSWFWTQYNWQMHGLATGKQNQVWHCGQWWRRKDEEYTHVAVALIFITVCSFREKWFTLNSIYIFTNEWNPQSRLRVLSRNQENWGCRNSIQYNLSLHECFMKLSAKGGKNSKSHYWVLDPNHKVLFEEGNYRRRHRRPVKRPTCFPHADSGIYIHTSPYLYSSCST